MDNFKNRLIFYTSEGVFDAIESHCITVLQQKDFISGSWSYQNDVLYLAGNKFSSLLMFCGCAPRIEFKPLVNGELGSNFVAIQFVSFSANHFYTGKYPFHYSCSKCSTSIPLNDSVTDNQSSFFSCPQCSRQYNYHKINWRRKAGFGQFFIEVKGIFEGEVIPSDELLNILSSITDSNWKYFYADESSIPI